MTDREKLIEVISGSGILCEICGESTMSYCAEALADHLIANGVTVQQQPRPLEEWGEDYGDVLWWVFPIEEPPYVGSPLDENWPGYHTHWTPIDVPEPPKEVKA